jgi:hypothetical protein
MKQIFAIITIFISVLSFAQIQEDFSDNDFTTNPTWLGDDSVFVVADDGGNLKLRSNKIIASSTFYLATSNAFVTNTQFEFNIRLTFATSGTNFVDIYLASDQSNLLATNLNGYFVRVGGTTDEVSLFKNLNGTVTKIIDGLDGAVSSGSNNNLKIKVVCSASNNWTLERDNSGTGNSYISEGTVNDNSINTSSFFGIKITQSTASFFQKHFLDDVYVGPIILDETPPSIVSATVIDPNNVDILFSEPVDQATAENVSNYNLIPFNGIASATRDLLNLSLVHLTPVSPFINGNQYTLSVFNIEDLAGNAISSENVNFTLLIAEIPEKGDIIITEFFADPTPVIGLPEIEFVEIYNKSNKIFNLNGWKLADNSSAGTIQESWLLPGEYRVLCPSSAVDSFPNSVAVTSFASLNNAGDNIVLRYSDNTKIIDSLTFTDSWYKDEVKKAGGYTIERINLNDPCSDIDNWIASISPTGGTPGSQNSVFDALPDTQAPSIFSLIALEPNYLSVEFNEGMLGTSLSSAIVSANPNLSVANVFVTGEFPNNLVVQFNEDFVGSQLYNFSIQNVADCWNNITNLTGTFTLTEDAIAGELIINEILSDPITGAYDFVEFYNNSNKLMNLKDYELANISNDTIANNKKITVNYVLYPNDYVVITQDSTSLKQIYSSAVSGKFIQMSLPSYSNDSGSVILLKNTTIIDKASYTKEWHFALLDDRDGKSMERIDPNGPTNDKNNWHTASATVGYATPGRVNSQLMYGENDGIISLTNPTFSPDNDGFEDVLQINYSMINSGMIASLKVYDDKGRVVKNLITSEIIGSEGTYIWDGTTEKNQKASIGTYILVFEAFDINGTQIFKKLPFVLAGKF